MVSKSSSTQQPSSEPAPAHLISQAPKASELRARFSQIEACLSPPDLLEDESLEDFQALFDTFLESVGPTDGIEYIYVRDAAILTFEINRLRRHKILLLQAAQPAAVKDLLTIAYQDPFDAKAVAQNWAIGNEKSVLEVEAVFKKRGLPLSAIGAKALEIKLDQIQKIEAMILTQENRRFVFFREIERRRDSFKRRLQEAVKNIDGSYSISDTETEQNSTQSLDGRNLLSTDTAEARLSPPRKRRGQS